MSKLRVKNFGPITEGVENNGFLEISKLSVFIGNQGTGKSTVAKIFSSFSWLEKNIFKNKDSFSSGSFTKLLKFHKINSYLKENTEIEYEGDFLRLIYKEHSYTTTVLHKNPYVLPQIQYIPAERNLLSVVDKYAQISYLPESVQDFMFVYDLAVQSDCVQNLQLPINNLKIRYNKRKHKVELFNDNYSVLLSEASSGLQSFVPFFVVQKFLIDEIFSKQKDKTYKNLEERQRISLIFEKQYGRQPISDKELLDFVSENTSSLFNSCVISILEEPEQNLFPDSQKNIVFDMLSNLSFSEHNKLLLTTHSPYFLPYINAVLKANDLITKNKDKKEAIEKIIPSASLIDTEMVHIYEFAGGIIKELPKIKNIASDDNLLNQELEETNEFYRRILKAGLG